MQQQTGTTRRTVSKGALWSVPIVSIATAAPSAAASPSCAPGVVDWDALATGTLVGQTTVNGTTLTVTSTVSNDRNLRVTAGPQGGISQKYLAFSFSPNVAARDTQTITFTFSRPVTNVSFTLLDLETVGTGTSGTTGFREGFSLSSGFTVRSRGSRVTGSGTAADPFTNTGSALPTETAGNVGISYAGPLTSFSITYSNLFSTNYDLYILAGISDISFTPVC